MNYTAENAVKMLRIGDVEAFRWVYNTYFWVALKEGRYHTQDMDVAFDIAQNVFIQIWNRRENFPDVHSLDGYIAKSAQYESFNWWRERNNGGISS
jgi:DNA-directed RNA polymerase specialized sigma24 family protein